MATETGTARLEDVLPRIRARREEIEKARRLPRDLVDELSGTGIFRLSLPRDVGGRTAPPLQILQTIETIAAADGSAGWCAMVGIANSVNAGYGTERAAREVFANPDRPTAGLAEPAGAAVRVDGGVRVTGRWKFASGITHSDWVWAGCLVMENGKPRMTPHGPEIIHLWMPVAEIALHDTWFVSGLGGTGSLDFSASELFVPEHRVFELFDPAAHRPEPLYQLPPLGWFVSQASAVSLGIGRAALDELVALAQTKVPTLSMAVLAERPAAQLGLARAEARLAAARAFLHESVDDMFRTLSAGSQPTLRQRALNRIAAANAAETGAAVAHEAGVLAGGTAIYSTGTLQRHVRDAEALTHHFSVAPHVWEDAGRVFLDRPPVAPVF
jgi:alkylation response protein AidB-like acyl-CoA dehydrogenase